MKKKILQIEKTIDDTTKKTLSETKVLQLPKEPEFVKIYVKDICALCDLKKNAYQVLMQCLPLICYDGHITLMAYHRKQIAENLGITDQTVKNQLCLLTKKNIFKRRSNMVYSVNPDLFGRGYWDDIVRLRDQYRLIIEYKGNKRVIKGESKTKYDALKAVD